MKTSSAKSKGRRLCAEIKDLLHKYAPDLQLGDILITSSGATGEDLKLSPAARLKYPFVIECKNQESLNIWKALEQADGHRKVFCSSVNQSEGVVNLKTETALVFFRRNRSKVYVALDAEEFIRMIS